MSRNIKPLLNLTEAAEKYWVLIIGRREREWTESDNIKACQVCRDLDLIEEITYISGVYDIGHLFKRVTKSLNRLGVYITGISGTRSSKRETIELVFQR